MTMGNDSRRTPNDRSTLTGKKLDEGGGWRLPGLGEGRMCARERLRLEFESGSGLSAPFSGSGELTSMRYRASAAKTQREEGKNFPLLSLVFVMTTSCRQQLLFTVDCTASRLRGLLSTVGGRYTKWLVLIGKK